MDSDDYILSKLFIAIPDLQFDTDLMALLLRRGLITQDDFDRAERAQRAGKKINRLRGKGLIERIMLITPEIMSVKTVDALRRWELIDVQTGNILKIGLRAGKLLKPGAVSDKTALQRWAALGNVVFNKDVVNLLRELDNARIADARKKIKGNDKAAQEARAALDEQLRISILRAEQMRSLISTGKLAGEVLDEARNANSAWAFLTPVLQATFSDKMLRNAIRAGAISQEKFELLSALNKLGLNVWRKGIKALDYNSLEARMLMVSEGILSPEMIDALIAAGILPKESKPFLYPAATAIRRITRGKMDDYRGSVKSRVRPGESPIKAFARTNRETDQELLRLLAEAASESSAEAQRLAKTKAFGKLTKAAQQRILTKMLHDQMRAVWENQGHLTIFGEKAAARAALASMDFLQDNLWKNTGKVGQDYRRVMQRQAEAAIDAYVSRQENLRPLSRRIYKNNLLSNDQISRRVNLELLKGSNAQTFARSVASYIRPDVPGGVSYASLRLARTEINNAFHFSQIRYTRDQPWVRGYKWNLSGSHPKLDICNTMADKNHNGLGRGVYAKAVAPGKPHPHCFCFLTTVTAGAGEFEKNLRSGAYDKYLNETDKNYGDIAGAEEQGRPSAQAMQFLKAYGPVLAASAVRNTVTNR